MVEKDTVEAQAEQALDSVVERDAQLQACQTELAQWQEKVVHVQADFENYKRRMEKEQSLWMNTAQAKVLTSLLDVVDNFDRALEESSSTPDVEKWLQGFGMIRTSLHDLLKKYGVTEIDQVTEFDPAIHEALMRVESDDHESGAIVAVLQKGYTMGDQVLRPAKVSVAQ